MWVQHGANSPFKRGRSCNGRSRQPGPSVNAERAGQCNKVIGVGRAAGSQSEHHVVAGVFAFGAQPRAGNPEQRIEPVNRAQDFRGDLRAPIPADNVRHLVREDHLDPIGRPRVGTGRKQDHGVEHTPGHEQRRVVCHGNAHRSRDLQVVSNPAGDGGPGIVRRDGSTAQPPEPTRRAKQHSDTTYRPRGPRPHDQARPVAAVHLRTGRQKLELQGCFRRPASSIGARHRHRPRHA